MTLPENEPAPVTRLELGLLAMLLLAGFALRAAYPSRLEIEHFDEGVYASNLYFDADEGFSYPERHLYAPPLVPWMLELAITIFGETVPGCFGVGIVMGTATIAAVWWVARRWFGSVAALSAATLLAFSGTHIVFSRTALTDVPMGLWFTLAVGLLGEAVRQCLVGSEHSVADAASVGKRRVTAPTLAASATRSAFHGLAYSLAAGVSVALAWWTKYNGWLPLAIGLAAILAWLVTSRPGWVVAKRSLLCWGIAAVTAVVLWSPVWWGLQSKGGYAAVAANHARYFHGPNGWWEAFRSQRDAAYQFEHAISFFLLLNAVLLPGTYRLTSRAKEAESDDAAGQLLFRIGRSRSQRWLATMTGIGVVAGLHFGLPSWTQAGPLVWGIPLALLSLAAWRLKAAFRTSPEGLGLWLVVAGFVSMLVLTPLYRPYPRLAIPWVLFGCLASSLFVAACSRPRSDPSRSRDSGSVDHPPDPEPLTRLMAIQFAASVVLLLTWSLTAALLDEPDVNRTGLARATDEMRSAMIDDARSLTRKPDCVAYVYAEPAVFFHLSAKYTATSPVGDLEFAAPTARRLPMPTYLVVGPHARRSDRFAQQWVARGSRFVKVDEWEYAPSLVVLLDQYRPEEVRDPVKRPAETIELYRLK